MMSYLDTTVYVIPMCREPFQLPWGARRSRSDTSTVEDNSPGAVVLHKLFSEFTRMANRKVEQVLAESLVSEDNSDKPVVLHRATM